MTVRRFVLIEANRQLYTFYLGSRLIAQYKADRCLDAEEVEQLRATHPTPPQEAA